MVLVLLNHRTNGVDHFADQGAHVELFARHRHLAGFDLRQIENAVDQLEQVAAGEVDPLQVGDGRQLLFVFRLLLQQLAVEDDGVERRPQLVAHARQEVALGSRGRLGLLLGDAELPDERRQPVLRVLPVDAERDGIRDGGHRVQRRR